MHIPRQKLRQILFMKYLSLSEGQDKSLQWNKQLKFISPSIDKNSLKVIFKDGEEIRTDLVVGCDGIWSQTRKFAVDESLDEKLEYLGIMVVLGITGCSHDLCSEKVFQTVNGTARFFSMPFSKSDTSMSTMWQLSFPLTEETAKSLKSNPHTLKDYVNQVCANWHHPIPHLIQSTSLENLMGIPAYDRLPVSFQTKILNSKIALLGDAAHPMSPFKGQGANQALLDSIQFSERLQPGVRIEETICNFHEVMIKRVRPKILLSRERAMKYHQPDFVNAENFLYPRVDLALMTALQKAEINSNSSNLEIKILQIMKEFKYLD